MQYGFYTTYTPSVVGLYGNFGQSNYVATKSGVIGMTKVWARELGRKGIRVNVVAPGFIATEMIETVPEKVIEKVVGQTPLARMGEPEDIANAYISLSSHLASFVSGTVLSVDGGIVLWQYTNSYQDLHGRASSVAALVVVVIVMIQFIDPPPI